MKSTIKINLNEIKKIHMIGIGGISMSGIAVMLKNSGYLVTGSDSNNGDMIEMLKSEGIPVIIGHDMDNTAKADLIIYTAAVKQSDPELVYAHSLNIPVIERAPFIGELLKNYQKTICISGMHGKTTTTSMIASAFMGLEKAPTVLVGSKLKELGNVNYLIGSNEYFILEACEYVDSFLNFPPQTAIILNIEEEHLDYFKDITQIENSFASFIKMLPVNGNLVINHDDENCNNVLSKVSDFILEKNIFVYNYSLKDNNASLYANNLEINSLGCYSFDVYINNVFAKHISLSTPGKHNVYNTLATIGSIIANDLNIDNAIPNIEAFTGASRRFEYKKTIGENVDVYDDYAHHPTEVKVTLESAKNKTKNRIISVFQPHTYTRTKALLDDFVEAFLDSDITIVTDIYAARELDDGSINSEMMVDKLVENGATATYVSSFEAISKIILDIIEPGDIVLTIGAGTITKLSDLL
ncbi:MAG: UDP-N-acetylmuramate--L-alanine ligase [Clostridia bacterium]|nr:UDP-N-acetylmuramate--L-alanine ligase [Clostridia bacterium]